MLCKNCEKKEAVKYSKYTIGEFCSRECARSYTTKFNRIQINLKVSNTLKNKNLKKENTRKCISCGNITKTKRSKYCDKCHKLTGNKSLYEKLGINNINLITSNNESIKLLLKEYFTNNKSLQEIRDKYKIMLNTLSFFFHKNGIKIRTFSESQVNAYIMERKKVSNKNNYKCGYHTTWFGDVIYYRSTYEKRMMEILDQKKEFYLYEKLRFKFQFENQTKIYIPDFYLPKRNLIIEVKGEWFQKRDKIKNDIKQKIILNDGYYFIMVGNKELKEFENEIKK
jgi:very-short-patch-repair endonuclease